jgi:hypothetical protein
MGSCSGAVSTRNRPTVVSRKSAVYNAGDCGLIAALLSYSDSWASFLPRPVNTPN